MLRERPPYGKGVEGGPLLFLVPVYTGSWCLHSGSHVEDMLLS